VSGQKANAGFLSNVTGKLASLIGRKTVRCAVLGAVTVAGLGLRYYRLGKWGFWRDEMFSVGDQEDGFNYSLLRQSTTQTIIRQIVRRWGIDERNARLVPALIGAASVPLLYPVLRRTFTPQIALVTSALLAISPWHLYWSQNARFYTLLLLLYSLALFTFYLGLEEDSPALLIASLFFLGLAARERMIALFYVPVVAAYVASLFLAGYPKPAGLHWRNLALYSLPGAAGALLFARPYLRNLRGWMEGFSPGGNSPLWLAGSFGYYLGLPVVLLALGSAIHGLKTKDRALLMASNGAFVPLSILVLITPFHYTANRYGFITLTSWLALAGYGLTTLAGTLLRNKHRTAAAALFALPFLQYLLSDLHYYTHNGNRARWKEALDYLHDRLQDGDRVFSSDRVLANHYLQRRTDWLGELAQAGLAVQGERSWVIEDSDSGRVFPGLIEWLARHAHLVTAFDVTVWPRTFKMRLYLVDSLGLDPEQSTERQLTTD
jgi:mannosyltransferase